MDSEYFILIGAFLGAISGFGFTYLEDRRKTIARQKAVAGAIIFEIRQFDEKMKLVKDCFNKHPDSNLSTIYSCLKECGIFINSSEYTLLDDKNAFEAFYADIFHFESDLDLDKLLDYYTQVREANRHLCDMLKTGREQQQDIRIITKKETTTLPLDKPSLVNIYALNCIECMNKANNIVLESNVVHGLKKIRARKWYLPKTLTDHQKPE
ncbi:MAG: hypothetical protein WC248_05470 [Candidatus Methanomethylophilaceae archaeon]|jgi:hypothetical protein